MVLILEQTRPHSSWDLVHCWLCAEPRSRNRFVSGALNRRPTQALASIFKLDSPTRSPLPLPCKPIVAQQAGHVATNEAELAGLPRELKAASPQAWCLSWMMPADGLGQERSPCQMTEEETKTPTHTMSSSWNGGKG